MLTLRSYQESSKEALRDGFRGGHIRQVLCAATGSGKSILAISMIKLAIEKGSSVIFIVERRVLAEQFSAHLDRYKIPHGVLMSKHWRYQPDQLVQVASAQTLEKMDSLPAFDLCILDEVHCLMRKSIINMIKVRPNMKIIGLTATPYNPKLADHFTNVINVVSMKQLIDEEHLVPFRVFAAHEINVKGLKVDSTGEFEKAGLESRGMSIVGDVVSDYIRLNTDVYGELRKAICFSCGVAHGAELARKFNEAGVYAIQISHTDSDEYKSEVIADFAKPDTLIKVVISSEILERGFDMGDVYTVILAKAVKKSFSKFVQMVGRGARPHPEKSFCVIQDHGCNWLRFSEQWNDLYHNGVTELTSEPDKSKKAEPTEYEKKVSTCPKCGCLWGGADICPQCGTVRTRKNKVETLVGEMKELNSSTQANKYSDQDERAWLGGLLFYARSHKKKDGTPYLDGWAIHKFKEKFNKSPDFPLIAVPPRPEVIAWITSRNIAYRKGKGR